MTIPTMHKTGIDIPVPQDERLTVKITVFF